MAEFSSPHNKVPNLWALNDLFTDGNENSIFYEHENLQTGTLVNIDLHGISEEYYNYINLMIQQSGQFSLGPFQATPVPVKGNCFNPMDKNEEVLGYFRLTEVARTTHTVH